MIAPHRTNTGFACTRAIPRADYELSFECLCIQGTGNVVFPVGQATSLWALRGRGGMGIGAEPLDPGTPKPAFRPFQIGDGRWYRYRLRVESARIRAWADDEQVLDLPTAGYRFGMWAGNDPAKPLGFFTVYDGSVKLRNIRIRNLQPQVAEAPKAGDWQSLFDGKTLDGWKGPKDELHVEDGQLVLEIGKGARNGFAWTGEFPKTDYELELDLVKIEGTSVCGFILPVGEVMGNLGIGDHEIGIGTARKVMPFPRGKWFRLRVRVTQPKVQVWVDDAPVIDLPTEGQEFGIWSKHEGLRPFGIHTRTTRIAVRNIRLRSLAPAQE